MAKSPRKSEGIQYFNQFPKYFETPYGAPQTVTPEVLNHRLSATNCEWYLRPNVAVSEMADTFAKCMPFVEESLLIDEKKLNKLKRKVSPFLEIVPKFNNKDDGQTANKMDVKTLITELSDETSKQFFAEMYSVGHAMKSMAIHFLVANHVTTDLPKYAVKSSQKNQEDDSFKTKQTKKSLIKYWAGQMVKARPLATATTTCKRTIASLFESDEDEDEEEVVARPPKKQKKARKM